MQPVISQIEKTIEMLRERVKNNLALIKDNQGRIRTILQEPVSERRTSKFDEHYSRSKDLLRENQDLINLQVSLVGFLDKYRSMYNKSGVVNEESSFQSGFSVKKNSVSGTRKELVNKPATEINISDVQELFERTVSGQLNWDPNHPMYYDEKFYNQLMEYFLASENYEACGRISKSRD